jgi:hypothetical protein
VKEGLFLLKLISKERSRHCFFKCKDSNIRLPGKHTQVHTHKHKTKQKFGNITLSKKHKSMPVNKGECFPHFTRYKFLVILENNMECPLKNLEI